MLRKVMSITITFVLLTCGLSKIVWANKNVENYKNNELVNLAIGKDVGYLDTEEQKLSVQSFDVMEDGTFVISDNIKNRILFVKSNNIINSIEIPKYIEVGSLIVINNEIVILDNLKSLSEEKELYRIDMDGNILENITIPFNEKSSFIIDVGGGKLDKIYRNIEYLRTNSNRDVILVYSDGGEYIYKGNNDFVQVNQVAISCLDVANVLTKNNNKVIDPYAEIPYEITINKSKKLKVNTFNELTGLEYINNDNSMNSYCYYYDNLNGSDGEYIIKQFNESGYENGIVKVEKNADYYRINDKFKISEDDQLYMAFTSSTNFIIRRVEFTKDYKSNIPERKKIQLSLQETSRTGNNAILTGITYPTIYRSDIAYRALDYIRLDWTYNRAMNRNDLNGKTVGTLPGWISTITESTKNVTSVPYNWGGCISTSTFLSQIAASYQAGNISTASSDVLPGTTGVDCSGFVWQCYGYNYKPSGYLRDYFTKLSSVSDAKYMDPCDLPGDHIVLYRYTDPNNSNLFYTYESTKYFDKCISYRRYFDQGYWPYRYPGTIIEPPTP